MKFLSSHGARYRYSQDSSAINLGIACYDKPVVLPNKKINDNYNKKNMEIFRYEAISPKCYKLREMFASGLENPWHN